MYTADIVQSAIDYIEEYLEQPVGLEQIAEAAAMSVPNLYRMFYAMTGHPIKEYIRKRRTSEAALLLRKPELSTKDIGFRCGFDTYQTFIKTFKRNTGLNPGVYRNAECIYSFEKINLYEYVSYLEAREVSERFPDVKVIRLPVLSGVGYLHTGDKEEGLEESALERFHSYLAACGIEVSRLRLFGRNLDLEQSDRPYGYQLIAVYGKEGKSLAAKHPQLQPCELSGGIYAVTRTPADFGPSIVSAWNRLLSEWLPRSMFKLGEHGYLEEYQ
jgi:AraC family transcriptional regulator